MSRNLLAITGNTFTETLRQPVYAVVAGAAILLLIFGPSLSMFTIDDDNMLLKDTGLSTLLVAGLFLAVFAAATVVHGEIENKTVLTVVTKTVDRYTFILGKFLGIAAAVLLAEFLLALVLLMVVRHGALQRASDHRDTVVLTFGAITAGATLVVGLLGNYFYRWRFTSTAVVLGTSLCAITIAALVFIDPYWAYNPTADNLDLKLIGPICLVAIATTILAAIAVAVATRAGLVLTLLISAIFFVAGTTLQPWLGPFAQQANILGYVAKTVLAIFPCINFFMVSNAIYTGQTVPTPYIWHALGYALIYVTAVLLFTMALFRHREIG
ncbi:MAG: hypothetical protein JW936_06485 [Sedimentisphaerales bacterium]|nr:hypothetical protein [Sedimentisphaerales bacterium]